MKTFIILSIVNLRLIPMNINNVHIFRKNNFKRYSKYDLWKNISLYLPQESSTYYETIA